MIHALLFLFLVLAGAARGQSNLYRFNIDQDALAGAPDFSYLNGAEPTWIKLDGIGRGDHYIGARRP